MKVLREHGVDGAEVDRIFAGVDMDESGSLHYMEFLAATIEARGYIEVRCGARAFSFVVFVFVFRVHICVLLWVKYVFAVAVEVRWPRGLGKRWASQVRVCARAWFARRNRHARTPS